MEQNLRPLFDRALADEPEPPPVDLAGQAMAAGTSLRRRRHRLAAAGAAGVVAIAALGVVTVAIPPDGSAPSETVPAGLAKMVNPACKRPVVRGTATDVAIFLTPDVTDQQRSAVKRALDEDGDVRTIVFVSREEALVRFRKAAKDQPELLASVDASQFPESFRIKLAGRSQYADLAARVRRMPGVDEMIGTYCPAGANAWTER